MDWNLPTINDLYTDFLAYTKSRDVEALTWMEGATGTANTPLNAKQWSTTNTRIEKWNGSSWVVLAAKLMHNVDQLDGFDAGNASGNVPVSNGTVNTNLNADMLDGLHAGNGTGLIPISNGTKNVNLNADLLDGLNSGNATGNIPISNGTVNTNLNADMVDGAHAGNASGNVALANGTVVTNLNADLLDGVDGANYTRADLTFLGKTGNQSADSATDTAAEWANLPVGYAREMAASIGTGGGLPEAAAGYFFKPANASASGAWAGLWIGKTNGGAFIGKAASSAALATWDRVWTAATDGAGSTLDADLLDGIQASSFARVDAVSNFTSAPTISGNAIWHAGNDGAGSGLDADLLDGMNAASTSTANTIVARTANSDIVGRYFLSAAANDENPTVEQFMVTNGSTNQLRKASVEHTRTALGIAGRKMLSTKVASASANLTFTSADFDWTTYDSYEFEFSGVVPASNGVGLLAQVSTNGGSSWLTTAVYAHASDFFDSGGVNNTVNSASDVQWTITPLGANGPTNSASFAGLFGKAVIDKPSSATRKKNLSSTGITYTPASVASVSGGRGAAFVDTTSAINGIKFYFEAASNIAEGRITVYGVKAA